MVIPFWLNGKQKGSFEQRQGIVLDANNRVPIIFTEDY